MLSFDSLPKGEDYHPMIMAFFESIKHVGYLFPLSLLRIYMGYLFFDSALHKARGGYFVHPHLAAAISEWLPTSMAPNWYREFLTLWVIPDPNWKFFAYFITYCEFLIGISFLTGFLVRPISILGVILSIHSIYAHGQPAVELHQIYLVLFIATLWMGAGRSLGLDYFFYKRQRGWLW